MQANPTIPIKWKEIDDFTQKATDAMRVINWRERPGAVKGKGENESIRMLQDLQQHRGLKMNLAKTVADIKPRISSDTLVLPDGMNHTINVLQLGLQIGFYMAENFAKSTRLRILEEHNTGGTLSPADEQLLREKRNSQTIVTLFSLCRYVVWSLKKYHPERLSSITKGVGAIPDISLMSPQSGIACCLFYLNRILDNPTSVNSDDEFVKIVLLYFELMLEELQVRAKALKHLDSFTHSTYQLEGSEFSLNGFNIDIDVEVKSAQISRLKFEEIVGNKRSKMLAKKSAQFLATHDVKLGKNPILEIVKNFPKVVMGEGFPGTGKTMMSRATGTYLTDICEMIGIPFIFHEFPKDIISEYQGKTAQNALAWFRIFQDTNKIIYAPIDDAEGYLKNRAEQGVSAGVEELVSVFLTQTEGSGSVYNGNWMIHVLTNYPDLMDPAVFSRIQVREKIPGAETSVDFIDQLQLWKGKFEKTLPDFTDLTDPEGFTYFEAQKMDGSLANTNRDGGDYKIQESDVQDAYDAALKMGDPVDMKFYGELYYQLQQRNPRFTSREVRNIQAMVDNRRMDFFYPNEWMDDPETFFRQAYDVKVNMLKELIDSNLKGKKVSDILLDETLRHADSFFRIQAGRIDREAEKMVEQLKVQKRAQQMIKEGE